MIETTNTELISPASETPGTTAPGELPEDDDEYEIPRPQKMVPLAALHAERLKRNVARLRVAELEAELAASQQRELETKLAAQETVNRALKGKLHVR
jgi:hypothetical protein